jgi:hypothetical protein
MKKIIVSFLILLSIFNPTNVYANTPTGSITGNTNITAGTRFTLTFAITNSTNIVGVESIINFNSNHFSIVNTTNLVSDGSSPFFNTSNNKYASFWTQNPRSGTVNFLRVEFQARPGFTIGTTSQISMTNTFVTQGTTEIGVPNRSITLTSIAPLSTVNTLSSISINGTNLSNFNSSTLNYNLSDTSADSITIGAVRTDSKSTLTGTGTFALRYGSNRFSLNVRSESGSTRTYTINVNRPDLRGDNTTIKSVSLGEHILVWNEDNSKNILLVPNSVANGTLNIELNESSSKVTSNTSVNLNVGENDIAITVQSEKGTSNTYNLKIVRANDQGVFPDKYVSTKIKHVLIDGEIYLIRDNKVVLPFNIESPTIIFVPESDLTFISEVEVDSLNFGDNILSLQVTSYNGTVENYDVNLFREDQMNPVSLSELLENIESYPVATLSFFYEGLISDEDIMNTLLSADKAFRVYVSTSSMVGYWAISKEEVVLLRDLDLGVEEDQSLAFQESLGFIIQNNFKFKELAFSKPLSFTLTQLFGLESYPDLYGYQMTSEGLVYLEDWSVTPLSSVIEVGGPLHLVVSPALIEVEENEPSLDIRYVIALAGATVLGWLLWLISTIRYSKLKRKFLKSKKGVF